MYELGWTKEALECLNYFKAKFPDYAKSHACETLDRDIKAAIFSRTESGMLHKKRVAPFVLVGLDAGLKTILQKFLLFEKCLFFVDGDEKADDRTGSGMKPGSQISEQEKYWRTEANDYEARFCGHCNTTTDIKEANFFGRCVSFLKLKCQPGYIVSIDGSLAGCCIRYNLRSLFF